MMNALRRELYLKALALADGDGEGVMVNHLIDLVVKETCNIVLHYHNVDEGTDVAKMHFGVEK
jgi:hypothetical protein